MNFFGPFDYYWVEVYTVFDHFCHKRPFTLLFQITTRGPRAAKISWRAALWSCLVYWPIMTNQTISLAPSALWTPLSDLFIFSRLWRQTVEGTLTVGSNKIGVFLRGLAGGETKLRTSLKSSVDSKPQISELMECATYSKNVALLTSDFLT